MKCRFFFALCFVLSNCLCLFSQSKKDVKNYRIKSLTEWITVTENGKEIKYKDTFTSWDKNGNMTMKAEYYRDGTIKKKETATFDSKGNKLDETFFEPKTAGEKTDKYERFTYKYDEDENKIEEVEYDASGKVLSKKASSYNSYGHKIAEVTFDGNGKATKKSTYLYNSKGLRVEKKDYNAANILLSVKTYEYTF